MSRRNFIIVDDYEDLGEEIPKVINAYYLRNRIFDFDIKSFFMENHFLEAKEYILNNHTNIDVIFSDQKLINGFGTDLFKTSQIIKPTKLEAIQELVKIYCVMHSNEEIRLNEFQDEHKLFYKYFVNSQSKNNIETFLNIYENKIISIKENGNPNFIQRRYQNDNLSKYMKEKLTDDGKSVPIKDILLLVMDKNRGANGDYYYFFYNDGSNIKLSEVSKKPETGFNKNLKYIGFLEGRLKSRSQEKFKINPLWFSTFDGNNNRIKLLSPYNTQLQIEYVKFDTLVATTLSEGIDPFFF